MVQGNKNLELNVENITAFQEIFNSNIPNSQKILLLGDFDSAILKVLQNHSNQVTIRKLDGKKIKCNEVDLIFIASFLDHTNLKKFLSTFIFEKSSIEINLLYSVDKRSIIETSKLLYPILFEYKLNINRSIQIPFTGQSESDYYLLDLVYTPDWSINEQRVMKNEYVARDIFMEYASSFIQLSDIILDIGCGIRPQEYIKPNVHICFDPFHPYLDEIREKISAESSTQFVLMNGDWEKATQVFYEKSVDTIFLLDIIEHLEKEEGEHLLKLTEKIARKQIIIFTPYGFVPQHHPDGIDAWGLEGGVWQEHKSGWLPEDFGEGWKVISCTDFHTHDNEGVKYEKPEGALWAIKNYEQFDINSEKTSVFFTDAKLLLETGENILRATGNTVEANENFLKALLKDPRLSDAYNNIGSIDYELGDIESAETYFMIAQKLDMSNKNYALNLVNIYLVQNQLEKASEVLESYLSKNPNEKDIVDELNKLKEKQMNTSDKKPQFTIIVPAYNQAEYLKEALDSLIAQTFSDWEAVVVNDGSKDNTADVMAEYQGKDQRIRCYHKENGGVATALNEGIRNASGEWICWLSSDDFFEPDKLQIHLNAINANPNIKFFYTHWNIFLEETKQKIKPPLWFQIPAEGLHVLAFFRGNYISGNSVAIHKSVFEKVGLFDERLWQGQDFDMWLRISAEFETKFIDIRTMTTRLHEAQSTNAFLDGGIFESTRSLFNFMEAYKFSQYFPLDFLNNVDNVKKIIVEIASIYKDSRAFIFGLGFNTFLLERLFVWLYKECNESIRNEIIEFIQDEFNLIENTLPRENFQIFNETIEKNGKANKPLNFFEIVLLEVKKGLNDGEQERVYNLEKFLTNIIKRENEIEYSPVLYGIKLGTQKHIKLKNVLNWSLIDPALITIRHNIIYKCDCGNTFNVKYSTIISSKNSKGEFICPSCKAFYEFEVNDFFNFITSHQYNKPGKKDYSSEISKIIFLTRDAHIIGGGNLIIYKYIKWLNELGYEIELFSFGFKPDWIELQSKFYSISSIEELKLPNDDNFIVIASSIFEIPELIKLVNPQKVFLLCQGFEGYHYGRDYLNAVSDKSFFEQMHSLPFEVISVSTHLVDLFYRKFNKKSYYIPNSVDHSIFKQNVEYSKKSNSIVFIGDPMHPLKGFSYLLQSIQNLVNSEFLKEKLKLIIITGGSVEYNYKVEDLVSSSVQIDLEIHARINSNEVAEIINQSKLLVCASWYEGFSLPVLEAMSCGTPVITTANQGAESFCINGYNSFVVNYGDVKSLINKIVEVLSNISNMDVIVENGKKTASSFTELKSFNSFVNSFSKITNKEFDPQIIKNLEKKLITFEKGSDLNNTIQQNVLEEGHQKNHLFSIIIPTFNRPNSLKKALSSISQQTFKNFEVIVINDGKKDVSKILEGFNDTLNYKLATHLKNMERSFSRNEGIFLSTGKYILFLDDDDIYYPNHLETLVENLSDKYPILYTDANRALYYSANGKHVLANKYVPYSMDYSRNNLLIGNISPINCFCIEKKLLEEVGLFSEIINVLEDWELLLRLSHKAKFKHLKIITCEVSWYSENSIIKSSKANELETVRNWIYKKYYEEIENIPTDEKSKIIQVFNEIWAKDDLFNHPLVSIIIPLYNQIEFTQQCLDSIDKFTRANYEVILIDNNSEDDTINILNNKYSGIKIIANKSNLGFPKAVNQGLLEAQGDYILLLNNDIIVTEGWLERMLEVAESDKTIGIVGPISNSVSWYQIDKEAKYKSIDEMHIYANKIKMKCSGEIFHFPRVAFLCTLIKKNLIEKIGGLDERFSPGNFEDDDFCLRAQLAGYKTVIAKDVFIHHFGSKSFTNDGMDKYLQLLERNKKIFVDKWGADPEQIWLKGVKPKSRDIVYPLNENIFTQSFQRAAKNIDEKDFKSASTNLKIAVENYELNDGGNIIDYDTVLNLAGNVAIINCDYPLAREYFEEELNLKPDSSAACSGLAEVFFAEENYEESKTMYEWAVKNEIQSEAALNGLKKVNTLLQLPEDDNSLYEESEDSLLDKADAIIKNARKYFESKNFDEALTLVKQAEELMQDESLKEQKEELFASLNNFKGYCYIGLNNLDEAKSCFESALQIEPNSSDSCAGLGELIYLSGNDEEAKTMFEWAVKNEPGNIFALDGLKKVNKNLGLEETHNSLLIIN